MPPDSRGSPGVACLVFVWGLGAGGVLRAVLGPDAVAGQVAQAAGAEDQRGGALDDRPLPPVSATSQSVMVAAAAPARCTPDPVTRVMVVR